VISWRSLLHGGEPRRHRLVLVDQRIDALDLECNLLARGVVPAEQLRAKRGRKENGRQGGGRYVDFSRFTIHEFLLHLPLFGARVTLHSPK
jgi:hypothetical protein